MNMLKTRRKIVACLLASLVLISIFFALRHVKQLEIQNRHAKYYEDVLRQQTNASGRPIAKVLSADRDKPVSNVIVGMTLIGPDGGDGGFFSFVTDETGIAHSDWPLTPGRYQYHLMPDPKSRFNRTYWRRGQPYVVISKDGTTSMPSLLLNVKSGG